MRGGFLSGAPPALRRAKLDNLALVPASLLPFKAEYQQLANHAPSGTTLIVLPARLSQRRTLQRVAASLRAKGRRVQVLDASALRLSPPSDPAEGC